MAIKRGVSFYSYQQAQYFGWMDWHDMCKELHDNLKCDGVEIINEATVPGYPFPSKEFLGEWHNTMARYGLKPIAFDGFLDTMRFRDHVLNYAEAAELLKLDLQQAHDMGFRHIRTMTGLPNEVAELALPTAEKLDVKIAWEIHNPIPIRPNPEIQGLFCENPGTAVARTVEFIEKTGTKHLGFQPDMGIFMKGPYISSCEAMIRHIKDEGLKAELEAAFKASTPQEFSALCREKYADRLNPGELRQVSWKTTADPKDLELILPYVFSFHGKVHNMVEIPGQPGHYDDPVTMNKEVIDILKKNNWDGYICTEYEGQRAYQDRGFDGLQDEVEQVRRHHEMLCRLIGEEE